ncbi:MAG TPA: histidinol-phosphate transaminase [Terriglobales bacterium]|jgi:histidinol-phosphate aminotransferase|nr:histidinol-phosphate transaminase [Terriglobales bacterium]
MLEAREAVKNLREYHPPLAGRTGLRLDFNESTVGCSPRVLASLRSLDADLLARYPEREPAEKEIASFLGLHPAQVLLTNGVDEAIHLLCSTYLNPADEVLIAVPTFAMYAVFAQAEGASIIEVPARDNFAFPTEDVLAKISPRTRLIAIANPNNPTGTAVAESVLMRIVQASPQAAVLVDEAYFEFHGETVIDQLRRTAPVENLFLARTFSKAYGLAGLRIGILAGMPKQMAMVRRVASPYSVNAAALAVLPEALQDQDYVAHYVAEVRRSRERLQRALADLGLQYWPSHANFVLVRIGSTHSEFVRTLRDRGILVRDRSSDPCCEGCVRLTVGTDEHTQTLIHALREVVEQLGLRSPSEILPNGVRA